MYAPSLAPEHASINEKSLAKKHVLNVTRTQSLAKKNYTAQHILAILSCLCLLLFLLYHFFNELLATPD